MLDYREFTFGIVLAAAPVAGLYIFLRNDFLRRKVAPNAESPSSFFPLTDLAVTRNLRFYANIYSLALCMVLWLSFGFCCGSPDFAKKIVAFLNDLSLSFADYPWLSKFIQDSNNPPVSLLVLIIAAGAIFSPHLLMISNLVKGIVQTGVGVDDACDRLVTRSAEDVRRAVGYARGIKTFSAGVVRPREFKHADDRLILQYCLLDSVVANVPRDGLIIALRERLKEENIASSLTANPPALLSVLSFTTPIVFFTAATFGFAFLLPLFGNVICGDKICRLGFFGMSDFPAYVLATDHKAVICDLLLLCCQASLQIVIPLWFGLFMLARRKQSASNIGEANFSSVAALQIIFSLLMGTFYSLVNHIYGQGRGGDLAFLSVERAFDAWAPCIVAPTGLFVWRWLENAKAFAGHTNLAKTVVAPLVCGSIYGLVGLGYSILTNDYDLFPQGFAVGWFLTLISVVIWEIRGSDESGSTAPPLAALSPA